MWERVSCPKLRSWTPSEDLFAGVRVPESFEEGSVRYPHAYDAPPEIQVQVAAEVQARQGWEAWPTCARKVGLLP